jgi:hypothetical protein
LTAVHLVSMVLTLVATVISVGVTCYVIATWKVQRPRACFAFGAAISGAGVLAGGWLEIVLAVLPILAMLALTSHRQYRLRNAVRNEVGGEGPNDPKNLLIGELIVVLAIVLLPYAAASEMLVSAQRTSVATPKIVSKEQVTVYPASGARRTSSGVPETRISYEFTVGQNTYDGVATHLWSADQIVSAKVCYDPNNIDGSHAIELATYQCGSLDLHPNG